LSVFHQNTKHIKNSEAVQKVEYFLNSLTSYGNILLKTFPAEVTKRASSSQFICGKNSSDSRNLSAAKTL